MKHASDAHPHFYITRGGYLFAFGARARGHHDHHHRRRRVTPVGELVDTGSDNRKKRKRNRREERARIPGRPKRPAMDLPAQARQSPDPGGKHETTSAGSCSSPLHLHRMRRRSRFHPDRSWNYALLINGVRAGGAVSPTAGGGRNLRHRLRAQYEHRRNAERLAAGRYRNHRFHAVKIEDKQPD